MSSPSSSGPGGLTPGSVFHERYRIIRCIKAGAMGAVYEVVDDRIDSPRALKVMLPSLLADADMRARFALEARVTGNIASDHIVRVSDAAIDEQTGTPFLVMELLQGEDLGSLSKKRGPLPPMEVVVYLHQAALALDKTHAAGIVHRDLKPDNLFITRRDDGSPCVKILDFGIAKVVAQSSTQATRAMGTPMYMAPEQLRGGAIGPAADLLALGHIAYALLSGEPYWHHEVKTAESIYPVMASIMGGVPEAPTMRAWRTRGVALPAGFDAWFLRATALQPQDRFDRATTQVAALAEAIGVPWTAPSGSTSGAWGSAPSGQQVSVSGSWPSGQQVPVSGSWPSGPQVPASGSWRATPGASGPLQMTPSQPVPTGPTGGTGVPVMSEVGARPRSRAPIAVGACVVIALGVGIGIGGYRAMQARDRGAAAGQPLPSASADAPPASASAAAPQPAPDPSVAASVATAPPPVAAAPPPATATAAAAIDPPPSAPPSKAGTKPGKPASTPAASKPQASCDPPFEFDAKGNKVFKKECM